MERLTASIKLSCLRILVHLRRMTSAVNLVSDNNLGMYLELGMDCEFYSRSSGCGNSGIAFVLELWIVLT